MNLLEIPRLIDISAVRTNVTLLEIDEVVRVAKTYRFICAFAMPCFTEYLVSQLKDDDDIKVGGTIGFPSGADTTAIKVDQVREMLKIGVDELDMVINVGALKSSKYDIVEDDIKAVVDAGGGLPVKSILEIAYLSDYEIAKASELAVRAGVTYVKTGTGWGPKPTTVDTIKLIKKTIGNSALIKAAGGVSDLQTVLDMIDAGCSRFGIGMKSAIKIMEEIEKKTGKSLSNMRDFKIASGDNY